ncbi:MAG: phospholipase D family protein [Planctomycetes bacterium]|nr:phospholipase D family protein [Planctomycetota bacterium]
MAWLRWPPDAEFLMWLQIATGFMGALTLLHFLRVLGRKLGQVPEVRTYFSPKGGCQEAIVAELQKARREILVQAYSFTADPLTYGLVDAKKRGVTVEILLDKSNEVERYSDLRIFLEQGLDPHIDAEHAIAHNKIIIIDQRVLISGSYNFTNQAEGENAENLLIFRGHPELIRRYRENFIQHKSHCKPAHIREGEFKDRRAA